MYIDSQAVIQAATSNKPVLGHMIVRWSPGHSGIPGNKAAYKVARGAAEGNTTTIRHLLWLLKDRLIDALTLDQFHHCIDHISSKIAQKLVDNEIVTGMHLEMMPFGDSFFCKFCVYVKVTWKLILKEQKSKHAKVFGEEIHSDL